MAYLCIWRVLRANRSDRHLVATLLGVVLYPHVTRRALDQLTREALHETIATLNALHSQATEERRRLRDNHPEGEAV